MQNSSPARFVAALVIVVAVLLCRPLVAKSKIDGDWEGSLDSGKYVMVFHIRVAGTCTVDTPAQGIRGLPANVLFDDNDKFVRIDMPGGGAAFEGSFKGSQIVGTFRQAGSKSPLTLTRRKKR
jgi:hypothetical protein